MEILGEMLTSIESQGGKIDDSSDEAIIELYSSVKSSQPIINKMIEQSSDHDDNEEDVNKLLALNESANNVINKFQLLKVAMLVKQVRLRKCLARIEFD